MVFAQAMMERGVLESAALMVVDIASGVGEAVQTRAFVVAVLVVALGFLLIRRR
jgi:hypothetical protein